jgi:mRNA interferase MazF
MRTKVQKWGHSLGVRIPRGLAEEWAWGRHRGQPLREGWRTGLEALRSKPAQACGPSCGRHPREHPFIHWDGRCRRGRRILMSSYVPHRGDLVWLEFTPQAGSVQRGRRPALVLSPKVYNGKVGLPLFCSVTSKIKGYPFDVQLPDKSAVSGVVQSDQLMSLDWRSRKVKFIERASSDVMAMVTARMLPLIEPVIHATL